MTRILTAALALCLLAAPAHAAEPQRVTMEELQKRAEGGDIAGQIVLGKALMAGVTGKPDPEGALKWLSAAAEQGAPEAMYLKALILARSPDQKEAVDLFRQAAEKGYAKAQTRYAWLLLTGSGVSQDVAGALDWYDRAVLQGEPGALFQMGTLMAKGEGVEKNEIEAYALLQAADQRAENERLRAAISGALRDLTEALGPARLPTAEQHARAFEKKLPAEE